MKISSINLYFNKSNKINSTQKKVNISQQNSIMPDYRFFQSFLGGYTTNLLQTYKNLSPEQYPTPDIKHAVEIELQNPNTNKTLYDVHFEKYKGVVDCYDLFDLVQKYPEFNYVQPASYTETLKGSFIDDFQKGQYEIFNNGEDLTLQLIKLYWGQGFSLSDLSNYIAQNSPDNKPVNLYYTMKKLNIPLMTKKYGAVLKLSNKEYNEKFTSEMSIRLKEAKEAQIQRAQGEPVIIPRGELSDAHKQHISEGLKRYFQQHPEKMSEMSERQKRFYEENPQKAQELSAVMDYAWNKTQEGKSVARGLSRFLKKQYNMNIKESEISKEFETIDKNAMALFWDRNSWAKAQFSQAVLKGWEYVKTFDVSSTYSEVKESSILPKKLAQKIELWAKKQGYDFKEGKIGKLYFFNDSAPFTKEEEAKVQNITHNYFLKFPHEADCQATIVQFAILSILHDLEKNINLPKSLKGKRDEVQLLKQHLEEKCEDNKIYKTQKFNGKMQRFPVDGVDSEIINKIYIDFVNFAYYLRLDDTVLYFERKLNEAYALFEDGKNLDIPKMFRYIGADIGKIS